jgi:hypothetical protein
MTFREGYEKSSLGRDFCLNITKIQKIYKYARAG